MKIRLRYFNMALRDRMELPPDSICILLVIVINYCIFRINLLASYQDPLPLPLWEHSKHDPSSEALSEGITIDFVRIHVD